MGSFENATGEIDVTLAGISMRSSFGQFANAKPSIESSESGSVTTERESHLLKHCVGIVVTFARISTSGKYWQF